MVEWPSYLPNPTTSFKIETDPNIERTPMASGYFRQRRRFSRNNYQTSIVWEMSSEEYELFKSFCEYEINGGSDWFKCPIPENGTIQTQEVRIIQGKYSAQYLDFMYWRVTIKADIKNVNIIPKEYLDLINNPDVPIDYWSSGVLDALELCVNGMIIE